MRVELTNRSIEMSAVYDIEKIIENKYGEVTYFKFYFGHGKYSKEYQIPYYDYRVLGD